jgi:hypothetical protein
MHYFLARADPARLPRMNASPLLCTTHARRTRHEWLAALCVGNAAFRAFA